MNQPQKDMASQATGNADETNGKNANVQEWVNSIQRTEDGAKVQVQDGGVASGGPPKPANQMSVVEDDLVLGAEAKLLEAAASNKAARNGDAGEDPSGQASSRKVTWGSMWSQARQESQNSEWSNQSTITSIDMLLHEREGDPEEILTNLGFGSKDSDVDMGMRIPERFLRQPSVAEGVSVDLLYNQYPDLKDILESNQETKAVPASTPSPQPRSPGISFYDVVKRASFVDRFVTRSRSAAYQRWSSFPGGNSEFRRRSQSYAGLSPAGRKYKFDSILHPNNINHLAEQGLYDQVGDKKEGVDAVKAAAMAAAKKKRNAMKHRWSTVEGSDLLALEEEVKHRQDGEKESSLKLRKTLSANDADSTKDGSSKKGWSKISKKVKSKKSVEQKEKRAEKSGEEETDRVENKDSMAQVPSRFLKSDSILPEVANTIKETIDDAKQDIEQIEQDLEEVRREADAETHMPGQKPMQHTGENVAKLQDQSIPSRFLSASVSTDIPGHDSGLSRETIGAVQDGLYTDVANPANLVKNETESSVMELEPHPSGSTKRPLVEDSSVDHKKRKEEYAAKDEPDIISEAIYPRSPLLRQSALKIDSQRETLDFTVQSAEDSAIDIDTAQDGSVRESESCDPDGVMGNKTSQSEREYIEDVGEVESHIKGSEVHIQEDIYEVDGAATSGNKDVALSDSAIEDLAMKDAPIHLRVTEVQSSELPLYANGEVRNASASHLSDGDVTVMETDSGLTGRTVAGAGIEAHLCPGTQAVDTSGEVLHRGSEEVEMMDIVERSEDSGVNPAGKNIEILENVRRNKTGGQSGGFDTENWSTVQGENRIVILAAHSGKVDGSAANSADAGTPNDSSLVAEEEETIRVAKPDASDAQSLLQEGKTAETLHHTGVSDVQQSEARALMTELPLVANMVNLSQDLAQMEEDIKRGLQQNKSDNIHSLASESLNDVSKGEVRTEQTEILLPLHGTADKLESELDSPSKMLKPAMGLQSVIFPGGARSSTDPVKSEEIPILSWLRPQLLTTDVSADMNFADLHKDKHPDQVGRETEAINVGDLCDIDEGLEKLPREIDEEIEQGPAIGDKQGSATVGSCGLLKRPSMQNVVQESFEMEEIQSADMLQEDLPNFASGEKQARGVLVRTGSAQSDSSGFADADNVETGASPPSDQDTMKVAHLGSSCDSESTVCSTPTVKYGELTRQSSIIQDTVDKELYLGVLPPGLVDMDDLNREIEYEAPVDSQETRWDPVIEQYDASECDKIEQLGSRVKPKRTIISKLYVDPPTPRERAHQANLSQVSMVIDNGQIREIQNASDAEREESTLDSTKSDSNNFYGVSLFEEITSQGMSQNIGSKSSKEDCKIDSGEDIDVDGSTRREVSCLHLNVAESPQNRQPVIYRRQPGQRPDVGQRSKRQAQWKTQKSRSVDSYFGRHGRHEILSTLVRQPVTQLPGVEGLPSYAAPPTFHWPHSSGKQHLVDEVKLLQQALQKYKAESRALEIISRETYRSLGPSMSPEERDDVDSLEMLRMEVIREVMEMEKLLASRMRAIIAGAMDVSLPDLASMDIIQQMIELLKEQVYHKNVVRSIVPRDEVSYSPSAYHHHHHRHPASISSEGVQPASLAAEHLRWELESTSSVQTGTSSIVEQLNELRQQMLLEQAKHQQQMAAEVQQLKTTLIQEIREDLRAEREKFHQQLQVQGSPTRGHPMHTTRHGHDQRFVAKFSNP